MTSNQKNKKPLTPRTDTLIAADNKSVTTDQNNSDLIENKSGVEIKSILNNTELVYYYGYLLGQLQYEGSGIWSRFNIMIGLNISLFGLMAFLSTMGNENKDVLILIVSIGGLLFSIWSLSVLKRLWLYHYHWKDSIQSLEILLPDGLVKPFTKIPFASKKKKRNAFKVWFNCYTQPFFIILIIIWLSIISINILSILKKNRASNLNSDKTELKNDNTITTQDSLSNIIKIDSLTNKIK